MTYHRPSRYHNFDYKAFEQTVRAMQKKLAAQLRAVPGHIVKYNRGGYYEAGEYTIDGIKVEVRFSRWGWDGFATAHIGYSRRHSPFCYRSKTVEGMPYDKMVPFVFQYAEAIRSSNERQAKDDETCRDMTDRLTEAGLETNDWLNCEGGCTVRYSLERQGNIEVNINIPPESFAKFQEILKLFPEEEEDDGE